MARSQSFYDYEPSFVAAIIYTVLYVSACGVTIFQYIRTRAWFWTFMVLASIMEAVGYAARVVSVKNERELVPFIVSFLPIFLAPAIIAASCYMAMGRLVLHVTPMEYRRIKLLWVPPRWMTPIFFTCDVIAFLIQLLGGVSLTSEDLKKKEQAYDIMKIGLSVQLACFGLFLVITARFYFVSKRFRQSWPDAKWRKFLFAINAASLLIFVRSIYRMVEFSMGFDGYLMTHEWSFYVFEAAVMLPVFILFNVYHPADYLSNIGWRQKRNTDFGLITGSDREMGPQTVNMALMK